MKDGVGRSARLRRKRNGSSASQDDSPEARGREILENTILLRSVVGARDPKGYNAKGSIVQSIFHPFGLILLGVVGVVACYFVFLSIPVRPGSERAVGRLRLKVDLADGDLDAVKSERLLVCMPTVARPGDAEYVSNAIKSWRLSTRNIPGLHRLVVFDMNADVDSRERHRLSWLRRVFGFDDFQEWTSLQAQIGWLLLRERLSDQVPQPVRRTHGDSEERIAWRSKEASDYAEVLERCVGMATGDYVAIVQDDVLFTERMNVVLSWLDARVGGSPRESPGSRSGKSIPWCSASLFDIRDKAGGEREGLFPASDGVDGYEKLRSSNMVARVFDVRDGGKTVGRLISALRRGFDASPVDWLADAWCKKRRRVSFGIVPNVVKHRGRVSSFGGNKREGTLT